MKIIRALWLYAAICLFAVGASTAAIPAMASSLAHLPGHVSQLAQKSTIVGRMPARNMDLAIVLPLRDPQGLSLLLQRLYDPKDSLYGHFLSVSEFTERFAPTAADYAAVASFATSHGLAVTATHPNRLVLDVHGPSTSIESTFNIHLDTIKAPDGKTYFAPDQEPSVDSAIAPHVLGVVGLSNTGQMHPNYVRPSNKLHQIVKNEYASGPEGLAPADIDSIYNLTTVSQTGSGQTLGLFELDGYTPSDIAAYESEFSLPKVPLTNTLIDGFNGAPGSGAAEVTLDIELQAALAPNATKIIVYEGPNGSGVSIPNIDVYNRIATDNLAKNISSSWGAVESTVDPVVVQAENVIFQEMAAQGQSLYIASGDNGAFATASNFDMAVQDPSAQPWCCGVGGTAVTDNSSLGYVKETTWNELSSDFGDGGAGGGGISVNWPIPAYQAPSVTAASLGSTAYRNIPDVSLNSDPDMLPYDVYFSDPDQGPGDYGYGGTSCAAPLWAGFTARVNQARLTAKLPLLGFPNTALYAIGRNATEYAADFHDIADNSNNGVFPAVKGYDLATGLGSFSGKSLFTQLATMTNTFSGVPTPISLAAPAASAAVSLTWYDDTPAGATFKVYRASGPVGPWTLLGTVSTKSYKNTGLTNGTTYYYEVEAVSGSSTSAMSQPYAVTPVASFTSTTPVVTIAPKYRGVVGVDYSYRNGAWLSRPGGQQSPVGEPRVQLQLGERVWHKSGTTLDLHGDVL
jgi:kumamolisin